MSQGLFDKDVDSTEDSDDEDVNESAMMLPSGGNKERKTVKEKRKATERKKEVNDAMLFSLFY